MKLTSGLTRHINAYTSQIIQQVLPIHMQLKQDMPMPGKDSNVSDNIRPYKDEEFRPEAQNIEKDYKDLVGKILDTGSRAKDSLSDSTPQNRLLGSELSSSLREIRFSE